MTILNAFILVGYWLTPGFWFHLFPTNDFYIVVFCLWFCLNNSYPFPFTHCRSNSRKTAVCLSVCLFMWIEQARKEHEPSLNFWPQISYQLWGWFGLSNWHQRFWFDRWTEKASQLKSYGNVNWHFAKNNKLTFLPYFFGGTERINHPPTCTQVNTFN